MNILVTGGAGYIGSALVQRLCGIGHSVTVLDNLLTGTKSSVDGRAIFVEGDVRNVALVEELFRSNKFDVVFHLAAISTVDGGSSDLIEQVNVVGSINILQAACMSGVKKFIFTSSSSVYGDTDVPQISEEYCTAPVSDYGLSKLRFENLLRIHVENSQCMKHVILRLFNVAGALLTVGEIGAARKSHLIPILVDRAEDGEPFKIFGDNHPTPDGTCVRDYIALSMVVEAHVTAMDKSRILSQRTINVGTGVGTSVREMISLVEAHLKLEINVEVVSPREGDPPSSVADIELFTKELDPVPGYTWTIERIIESTARWLSSGWATSGAGR